MGNFKKNRAVLYLLRTDIKAVAGQHSSPESRFANKTEIICMHKPEAHGPLRSLECTAMKAIFSQNTVNVA